MRTSSTGWLRVAVALVGVGAVASGCASDPPEHVDESTADFSLWPVDDLKNEVRELVNAHSAARDNEWIAWANAEPYVRSQLQAKGMTPESSIFVLRTKHSSLISGIPFDHSEVDIEQARQGNKQTEVYGRLLGDIWGAGLYQGRAPAKMPNLRDMGPPLCVTWSELTEALAAAYRTGHYAIDFVCHNVTFAVLDRLSVSVHDYSAQTRGWRLASYAYGPIWAGTPTAPATDSEPAKRCARLGVR